MSSNSVINSGITMFNPTIISASALFWWLEIMSLWNFTNVSVSVQLHLCNTDSHSVTIDVGAFMSFSGTLIFEVMTVQCYGIIGVLPLFCFFWEFFELFLRIFQKLIASWIKSWTYSIKVTTQFLYKFTRVFKAMTNSNRHTHINVFIVKFYVCYHWKRF